MKKIFFGLLVIFCNKIQAQKFPTIFEQSNYKESATYFECIRYYQQLTKQFTNIHIVNFGNTDAGYPLQIVLLSNDQKFNPEKWRQEQKVIIFINNGIHPGEPDGIDASMMLARDIAKKKINMPNNVALAIIPVYNIGGCLNRNSTTRVNQNGPLNFGFRGNAQNLDLNRDFIKNDSKEAKEFAKIFHWLSPDIFIDNHVSDGADYQHTMTLLTTQQTKLGGETGKFLHDVFEPALYKNMSSKKWEMCPYVNFESANPEKGWEAFFDAPRYSSGYAALFSTIAFVPETHMLKPFKDRVISTYELMQSIISESSKYASSIKEKRAADLKKVQTQKSFTISWKTDTTKFDTIRFLGYNGEYKKSDVTGMDRLFYNHEKPFDKKIKFYNYLLPNKEIAKPKAYIIPQGWYAVIDLLKLNKVQYQQLKKDSLIDVEAYNIEQYKTSPKAYEKHYKHNNVTVKTKQQKVQFLKGDYLIFTGQIADRFLVETLEPESEDSYFNWNFFDAILQQKEGYSDYRWEDVAANYLTENPAIRVALESKKKSDSAFSNNSSAQLDFVYKNSKYYEAAHLRYPVYRLN